MSPAGEPFGRYHLLDTIAVGGMAEVLLARSASLGGVSRTCVIKRILPQYSRDLQFVSMFIDEARITIALEHPNIVRLFDFGQHEGAYFMAMEYVDGTDLASLMRAHLRAGRALPVEVAVFIARELLAGLHHAHLLLDHNGRPLGIVHRDVSPQNVLLSSAGEVKLTDFGIAAARNKLTQTSTGTVLGKAAYMAPEQACGDKVDFRADLWSVGVVLYESLLGDRLFAAENPLATVQRVMGAPIEAPSARHPELPKELDAVVLRALQRKRDERYASAREMSDALSAYLLAHPTDGQPFGKAHLTRFLASLEWDDDTVRMRPTHRSLRSSGGGDAGARRSPDAKIEALSAQLRADPNLWTVVAMGDRYAELKRVESALSAYRTAAAIFAYRGLLVQSICAYDGARRLVPEATAYEDLVRLGDLSAGERTELVQLLRVVDHEGLWQILQEADPDGLGSEAEVQPTAAAPVPLFGALGPTELARFALCGRVRRVGAGEVVIREGDAGDALYAVGHGRLVVYCTPGQEEQLGGAFAEGFDDETNVERAVHQQRWRSSHPDRVYLAGLADGDFFGEFSFLTERPRSASVEAISEGRLLEIRRAAVDQISRDDAAFTEPLLQFYKERVVELMMAKSPVFSLLEPQDRRALLEGSVLVDFEDQQLIVEEGARNDQLFFIKRGEVEVFRKDAAGSSIFINKLGQGQFFGEFSVLHGTPRSGSVRAMGGVSLLKIDRGALLDVCARHPPLRRLFEQTIAARSAEMNDRVHEHHRVFIGT
ncbi:MAG: cyclic nucleotide-binding domain-containing protein [Deltaproteobacteria bacterium]|nr:cyclic nucleotide-binding domain-containing protein [Deltaproteobacteria bacterium]